MLLVMQLSVISWFVLVAGRKPETGLKDQPQPSNREFVRVDKKLRLDRALPFATQPHLTIVLRRPNSNLFNSILLSSKSRPDRALPFTTRPQPTVVTKRRPILNSFTIINIDDCDSDG